MFQVVFGSVFAKFAAVGVLVAGLAGGMAATGALPGFADTPTYTVASANPTPPSGPGVVLDFPASVIAGASTAPAPAAPVEEIVEEIVVVQAPRKVSVPSVAPAPAPAPACVGEVAAVLNAIAGAVPAATTAEQAQLLLAQANATVASSSSCVAEAGRVGFAGLDVVNQLVARAGTLVGEIQALPVLVAPTPAQATETPGLVGGVVGGVGEVVGGTLNLVSQGLGLLGSGLNFLNNAAKTP